MSTIALQLRDYRLTTAQITYHRPDFPVLLQEYVWQEYDLAPDFPILKKFLRFWEMSLDGKIHSVQVASATGVRPARFRRVDGLISLH